MGRLPFPAWLPTVSGEPTVASRVRLFSASYKSLCSRNAVQSSFKPFPFRDLQIPLSATPLFCHLYKTPGCHPSTFLWATAWQRQCSTASAFSPRSNLSLAVPKNATYNLSPRLRSQSWQSPRKANCRNPPPRPTKPMANRTASRTPELTPLGQKARPRLQSPPAPLLRLHERTKRKSPCTGKKKSVFIPRRNLLAKPI